MKLPKFNWEVRVKSKKFWITFIPAALFLANLVLGWFGIGFDLEQVNDELMKLIESVFGILVIIGMVVDPTTPGVGDSDNALKK